MKFHKYHALGNDYLVLDPADADRCPEPDRVKRICDRHFGLGADGILYGPGHADRADFGLRILNPDGSEAEKSGNGLRIFARYLSDTDRVGEEAFTVGTPGGVVQCEVDARGGAIAVDMGEVDFAMSHIPVEGPEQEEMNFGEVMEANGNEYLAYVADIGNPHCVIPLKDISREIACRDGPAIESNERFPNRINVQFLRVVDRANIEIQIWERGAGYTLASGSSACASAAVAHRIGACDRDVTVHMPGGKIRAEIGPDYAVRMTGSATRVGAMELEDEALAFTVEP